MSNVTEISPSVPEQPAAESSSTRAADDSTAAPDCLTWDWWALLFGLACLLFLGALHLFDLAHAFLAK